MVQATRCKLHVASYELLIPCKPHVIVTSNCLLVASYKLHLASYEGDEPSSPQVVTVSGSLLVQPVAPGHVSWAARVEPGWRGGSGEGGGGASGGGGGGGEGGGDHSSV